MFDRIFELKYLPIVTPHNLLENIKLNNYESIRFSKKDGLIVCELVCLIDDESINFFYEFDNNEFLQSSYYYENGKKILLFCREVEFQNLINKYQEKTA